MGEAPFNHQVQFSHRAYDNKEIQHKISDHLMCSPRNHHQKALMGLSYHPKIQGSLMADINKCVSLQKAAQVRLDNIYQIRNRSTFINDTQQLVRIRDRIKMMQSMGYIKNYNQRETEEKKEGERKKLSEIFPNAIMMHI